LSIFTISQCFSLKNIAALVFCGTFQKAGIISKLRRRLTVQGDSETIDGGMLASLKEKAKEKENAEDVSISL
jgi:hypothetical protein